MSRQISYLLAADGNSDRALVPIIDWAIHRLDPDVEILEPDFRTRRDPVRTFLEGLDTGAMLVFVHRDAEAASLEDRLLEFEPIDRHDVVPVVPVRMTEAWLLIDHLAIARAADRPDAPVTVPRVSDLEALADPKKTLEELLLAAAGDPVGRRRKQFSSRRGRRSSVASLIGDFSPLEGLPAFRRFQHELAVRYPYRHVLGS